MKYILIIPLALSFALPAYGMEEAPPLQQQIDLGSPHNAPAPELTDKRLKEDLSAEVEDETENDKLALALFKFQVGIRDDLKKLLGVMEAKIKQLQEEERKKEDDERKVRLNGSTQIIMTEEDDEDFVVVSDREHIPFNADDYNVTKFQ